jgi:hypothetical protein
MTTQPQPPAAPAKPIAPLLLSLRDQRIILDAALARLYGVETRALNQAVKRNRDRCPDEFFFALTSEETARFSQTLTSVMIWIAPSEKDTASATLEKRRWCAADQFRANSGLKAQE